MSARSRARPWFRRPFDPWDAERLRETALLHLDLPPSLAILRLRVVLARVYVPSYFSAYRNAGRTPEEAVATIVNDVRESVYEQVFHGKPSG